MEIRLKFVIDSNKLKIWGVILKLFEIRIMNSKWIY